MSVKTRKEAEALILSRAQQDIGFRKQLIDDPKGVISRELEMTLPSDFKINVLQETDKNIYLVLPPLPAAKGELADVALDQVAGGMNIPFGGKGAKGSPVGVQGLNPSESLIGAGKITGR